MKNQTIFCICTIRKKKCLGAFSYGPFLPSLSYLLFMKKWIHCRLQFSFKCTGIIQNNLVPLFWIIFYFYFTVNHQHLIYGYILLNINEFNLLKKKIFKNLNLNFIIYVLHSFFANNDFEWFLNDIFQMSRMYLPFSIILNKAFIFKRKHNLFPFFFFLIGGF